jgi:hypothetical protein
MEELMPTKTFAGKDDVDLQKQIWDWKLANPKAKELSRKEAETLPLDMTSMKIGAPIATRDRVSIAIDYQLEK